MKKKALLTLLAVMVMVAVQAGDYNYLTLQTADEAKSVEIGSGLTLTLNDDGTLTVGGQTMTLSELSAMYFTTTPIELVNVGDMGWATNCSANVLDYASADGLTAYQVAFDDAAGTIVITPVKGAVAAGEGVLLEGEAGSYRVAVSGETATALSGNDLKGTLTELTASSDGYYALAAIDASTVGFKKVSTGVAIPAGKAYYYSATSSRSYYVIGSDATAVESVVSNVAAADGTWYDLSGRQLDGMPAKKGVYIVNGKKVIIK